MSLYNRIRRSFEAILNAHNPKYIQENSLSDINHELMVLGQKVASAKKDQKFLQRQYEEAQTLVDDWQQNVQQARQTGDVLLINEALTQQQHYADTALEWKAKLEEQTLLVDSLKRERLAKKAQISETKTKADMLRARTEASKAQKKLKQLEDERFSNSEPSVIEIQEYLVTLRQTVASAIATLKETERQYNQAQVEADNWQQRVQKFRQERNVALASEALSQQQYYADKVLELKAMLEEQTTRLYSLKRNLLSLEEKADEVKVEKYKRTLYKLSEKFSEPQQDLEELREAIDQSLAIQKYMQQRYEKVQEEVNKWQERAQSSFQEHNKALADECLRRKESCSKKAAKVKAELDELTFLVNFISSQRQS